MNRVLIEVTSPAAAKTYDMFVPDTMQIGDIIPLIKEIFAQTSGGTYCATDSAVLCEKKTGDVFDLNKTVRESGIKNGSKLLLY